MDVAHCPRLETGQLLAQLAARLELSRGKRHTPDTPDRPDEFDASEAAAISGVPAETLQEWRELGLVAPTVLVDDEDQDGETDEHWSELDLLRAMIVSELVEAGVPALVLALVARDLADDFGYCRPPLSGIADHRQHGEAVPRTLDLANRWVLRPPVTRSLLTERDEASAAIAAGEAVESNHGRIAADLCGRSTPGMSGRANYAAETGAPSTCSLLPAVRRSGGAPPR